MQKDHHFVTITDKNDRNTHKLIREKYDVILESDKDIINDDNDDNDDVLYYKTPQIYTKLRKYIEKNPAKPEYLISVRGVGYMYTSQN